MLFKTSRGRISIELKSKPPMSVRAVYEEELLKRGYQSDPAQLRAIEALERCASEWAAYKSKRTGLFGKFLSRPAIPKGVYMFGGVGRGKSFLMDCFFAAVPWMTASSRCTSRMNS